jgi:broad specificity phosphatase PhoE
MRLYIIRHADPDYPNGTITLNGHREASALADHLKTTGIDEIYTSPMGRARHTAQYSANQLGLPVQIEEWAGELNKAWFAELDQSFLDIEKPGYRALECLPGLSRWKLDGKIENPEVARNMQAIRQGSDDFLARQGYTHQAQGTLYKIKGQNVKKIAFFAHMGLELAWLSYLLGIPFLSLWDGFFVHPSSITTVLFEERFPGKVVPRCIGLGDISHLVNAGLAPQPTGIVANYY